MLRDYAAVVPGGMLVFFPSYTLMEKCVMNWYGTGFMHTLCAIKPVVVEPRQKVNTYTNLAARETKCLCANHSVHRLRVRVKDAMCRRLVFLVPNAMVDGITYVRP